MNTSVLAAEAELYAAERQVLKIQAKLHQWAIDDPGRRFADLFNLVADPAVLRVAWDRVRSNRGARSAGVDGVRPRDLRLWEQEFLSQLRAQLKAGTFTPLPVRQRMIPKAGGKLRKLGIPTAADRTVQAALKLLLEPIFEADFEPVSYGFRPGRRPHDAIAEIHMLATNSYEWVLEGDITACFDEISHPALLARVRERIADKRVVALVKAFLKSGVLSARPQDARRIVLQFVYDSLEASPESGFPTSTFDAAWASFESEWKSDAWVHVGTCYLRNFVSVLQRQALVDGISIHHRSSYDFRGMG